MNEVWKAIPGFSGYEVSNFGQVRSYFQRTRIKSNWVISDSPQRILLPAISKQGYKVVQLRKNGKSYARRVHILVALTFIGPRPKGYHVCHRDCDSSNNYLNNLRYDTPTENAFDTLRLNRHTKRMKPADVLQLRLDYANGLSLLDIANKYKTSVHNAYGILRYVTYKEIGGPEFKGRKLPPGDIREMRILYQSGVSLGKLSKKYHRDPSAISRIVNNKMYKHIDVG